MLHKSKKFSFSFFFSLKTIKNKNYNVRSYTNDTVMLYNKIFETF